MSINFTCFYLAAVSYLVFGLAVIGLRVGHWRSPFRGLVKLHLALIPVYLLITLAWERSIHSQIMFSADWWTGLLCYFAFHYGVFIHIWGQLDRGFSANICFCLYRHKRAMSEREILAAFGGGRGVQALRDDRLAVMRESGTIEECEGKIFLTDSGRRALRLTSALQRLWNISFLGEEGK